MGNTKDDQLRTFNEVIDLMTDVGKAVYPIINTLMQLTQFGRSS